MKIHLKAMLRQVFSDFAVCSYQVKYPLVETTKGVTCKSCRKTRDFKELSEKEIIDG